MSLDFHYQPLADDQRWREAVAYASSGLWAWYGEPYRTLV